MSACTCRWCNGHADPKIVPPRPRIPQWKGLGADSEEKREPVSDIDTAVVDSLKVLDLKWPIREADIGPDQRQRPIVCHFSLAAILLFPIKRHPEHRQEQRKREDRKRPSNLVIHRPPINQGRESIYLVGEIQLFGRTALNIIEEPIRNFGNAETQCCCDERQDDNCNG